MNDFLKEGPIKKGGLKEGTVSKGGRNLEFQDSERPPPPPALSPTPISELPAKERLGTMLKRYRANAGKSLEETAKHLNLSPVVLGEVEKGMAALQAAQLQEMATYLDVRYEPLLDAARDWNRAIWEDSGKGGVRLVDTQMKEGHLREAEGSLESELIETTDKLIFLSNVLYEASRTAEEAAAHARGLLRARGISLPEDLVTEVECAGPAHDEPLVLRLPMDHVITYVPDDGDKVHFCGKLCAAAWAEEKGIEMKLEGAEA